MSNKEAQDDELLALASIYDGSVFSTTGETEGGPGEATANTCTTAGGQFAAHLDLPQPFHVKLEKETESGSAATNDASKSNGQFSIKYLPPLMLYFEVPEEYPSKQPPSITLASKWLTLKQLSRLCRRLDEIWEENKGDVILFMWTSFLKDETLEYLGILPPLDLTHVVQKHRKISVTKDNHKTSVENGEGGTGRPRASSMSASSSKSDNHDPRAMQDIGSQDLLLPTILEHDKLQRERDFNLTLFTCQVCFMEKIGALCMSFNTCGHVYCKDCMKGYFQVQIEDGSVKALTCPSSNCDSQAHPAQVKELVSLEQFQRYDRLLLQGTLDTMSDIMYCPRQFCGCAVLVDNSHGMGSCPQCHYVFCIFCKNTYHGISACKIKSDDIIKIRNEYLKADAPGKTALEKRYGRRMIQRVIEESYTNEWLEDSAKKCPHCKSWIQKTDGCNKMTCTKCRTNFCWLCGMRLPTQNPYLHFNMPASKCFNHLFYGVAQDELGDSEEEEDEDFVPPPDVDSDDDAILFRFL